MNYKKEIEEYWKMSSHGTPEKFDFEQFFKEFALLLEEKLALHGVLSLEKYISWVSKFYDLSILEAFVYESTHTNQKYTIKNLQTLIFRPRYEEFRKVFFVKKAYTGLLKLYKSLLECDSNSRRQKILLMERCIAAEHNSGNLIGLDIEKMCRIFEDAIEKLKFDDIFGILTRKGIEEEILRIEIPFNAILIDFDHIGIMNEIYGYEFVNRKIKTLFKEFCKFQTVIVGRWFSGDEIVIVCKEDSTETLTCFKQCAEKVDLGFKSIIVNCYSLEDIKKKFKKKNLG